MERLQLKTRKPVEEEDIECWDDDDFLDADELSFQNTAGPAGQFASRRRDSASSHVSLRSDLESLNGEEKQFHIPNDDETSTFDAIAAAQHAGIPLPQNVPTSALTGGTIKRLGGKKIQKIFQDDWENDLELPMTSNTLEIKAPADLADFPDTLRQVSTGSTQGSPTKTMKTPVAASRAMPMNSVTSTTSALSKAINLDQFMDDDDDDFFGDGAATIKVPKNRQQPQPVSFITPPTPQKDNNASVLDDDFEADLELPSDGKLKLSTRRDIPKTPSQADDLDWGEGSLGTRYGGTRRDGRFARSSSGSALSPSVSSSFTAESEDETFDGLVLPTGPVNFHERLQRRKQSPSPARSSAAAPTSRTLQSAAKITHAEPEKQDLLDGLDIGDGKVFDSGKLTLHRNIKIKESQPASPARPKAAVSLTFTNKNAAHSRLPRLSHERAHSTSLEPVYESGGPSAQRGRQSHSRLGHSSQGSVASLPTPTSTTAPPFPPTTPRRREITTRSSFTSLRNETATTNSQLLRQKRSLPAVRGVNSPVKSQVARAERPPSRSDNKSQSAMRPKTPIERSRPVESPVSLPRKTNKPFIPAGASQRQSQHVASKTIRQFRRYDSENAIDIRPGSRSFSRSALRSPSPQRYRVAADTWERLSRPKNKKNFGDGHELDGFDDLPTSKETETKYLKPAITTGPKAALRNKVYQNVLPDRISTPSPSSPQSPMKLAPTPRFARDTTASRIARETSLANRVPTTGPLANVTAQRVAQVPTRNTLTPQIPSAQNTVRSKKQSRRDRQQKPHLIANLNTGKESKHVNGMYYNADTFRWEGNENALNAFDSPTATQSPVVAKALQARDKDVNASRPALITNISATQGVQVVGGMVFDPQNMCWLKLGQVNNAKSETSDTFDGFNALEDDEDDVFKDIPDLDEAAGKDERQKGRVSDVRDEWTVGEEFDVGPEFVRRQREEEDRWRKKCEKWIGRGSRDRETWRWTIRELVSQFDDLSV